MPGGRRQEHAPAWVAHADPRIQRRAVRSLRLLAFDAVGVEPRGALWSVVLGLAEPPDLLVVGGPELDGAVSALLEWVCRHDVAVRVVVVGPDEGWLERCIRRGADAAVHAGFRPRVLRDAVSNMRARPWRPPASGGPRGRTGALPS